MNTKMGGAPKTLLGELPIASSPDVRLSGRFKKIGNCVSGNAHYQSGAAFYRKRVRVGVMCISRRSSTYPIEVVGSATRQSVESSCAGGGSVYSNGVYIDPGQKFKNWAARVESFPHEVICELPGWHSSTSIRGEFFAIWPLVLFERRAVSTYARFSPRKFARGRKLGPLEC